MLEERPTVPLNERVFFDTLNLAPGQTHYEMAVDGAIPRSLILQRDSITFIATEPFPDAATRAEYEHHTGLLNADGADNTPVHNVPDRTAAKATGEVATWIETDGEPVTYAEELTDSGSSETYPAFVFVYERIPLTCDIDEVGRSEIISQHLDSNATPNRY